MRGLPALIVLALWMGSAAAQLRIHTETIRPPAPPPLANQLIPPAERDGVILDPARLPSAVADMRGRILKAARSGDLQKLVALMQASGGMPMFSHTQRQDPVAIWKEAFPDSDGVEVLSILAAILDAGAVRLEAGTPQELYLWPYFAPLRLQALTPAQKVDLFRVITGSDYKNMLELGRYTSYRLGIGPDGTWRYFVAGL
jgi:hypothetical protein